MAENSVTLPAVLDTPEGKDMVREMLAEMARLTMERETQARCGAAYGARAEGTGRTAATATGRGPWDTRAGEIALRVPPASPRKLLSELPGAEAHGREGARGGRPGGLPPGRLHAGGGRAREGARRERGLPLGGESPVRGGRGPRAASSSRAPWRASSPFVWLDGTYVKVRDGGRIVSKAAILAVGLSSEGRREVLGMRVGHAESEPFWTELLRELLDRGPPGRAARGVGRPRGAAKGARALPRLPVANGAACTSCATSWPHVPQGKKDLVAATLRTAFVQEDAAGAKAQWRQVAETLRPAFPKVAALMEEAEEDALAYKAHPKELWAMLASNNGLERLNRELKRRADVVQIFPTEASVVRLVGAILMEQHDQWQVTRRQASAKALTGKETRDDALLARGGGG